jgi:hypothetical protein
MSTYPHASPKNGTRHHKVANLFSLYQLDAWPGDTARSSLSGQCYRLARDGQTWETVSQTITHNNIQKAG